jgi:hypothetical protein
LEDLFLNTSIPMFAKGFPWSAGLFERLDPFLFLPKASMVFLSRFIRELKKDKPAPAGRFSRMGTLRTAIRRRGEKVRSRFSPTARGGPAAAADDPGEEPAPDRVPWRAAGDLEWVLRISPQEAERGTWLNVAYSEDSRWQRLRVRVPAGLRDGTRLRVRSKGVPAPGEQERGDLYFRILIG